MKITPSWNQRIEAAKKSGSFTPDDKIKIGSYVTCLIGEKFNLNNDDPWHLGEISKRLGLDAVDAVYENNFSAIVKIYLKVQKLKSQKT